MSGKGGSGAALSGGRKPSFGPRAEKQAIFYQRSKSMQNEFALINLVTVREAIRGKLDKLLRDIKMQSRVCDQPCMVEVFNLVTSVRESTYDLVDSVAIWQQGFTQNIRPQLLNIDYLLDLASSMEFVSATHLRREFRFQLGAGNFMLLPLPTVGRKQKPYRVSKELAQALHNFANPTEHRLVKCYQILLNCMPKEHFKKIMSIDYWMQNRWRPNIEIIGYFVKPKEEKIDLLQMLLRGQVPTTTTTASSPTPAATTAAEAAEEDADADADADADLEGNLAGSRPQSPSRKASVAVARSSPSPVRPGSPSPLRPTRKLEIEIPGAGGTSTVLTFERKVDVFAPGGGAEEDVFESYSPLRTSPLRPPRTARAESPVVRKRQSAMARALEHGEALAGGDIFSDDSEDERIKREARDQRRKKKAATGGTGGDVADSPSPVGRGRREKPLAEAKTIEEKAARMSINTQSLRETWVSTFEAPAGNSPPRSRIPK